MRPIWRIITLVLTLTFSNKVLAVDPLDVGLPVPNIFGSIVSAIDDIGECEVSWSYWLTEEDIYRARYEPASGLSPTSVLDISSTKDRVNSRVVSLNHAATGLMVWSGQHGLYSSRHEAGGDWQAPVTISAGPSPFVEYASALGLGVDAKGNGLLTWVDDNGAKIYGSRYLAGSGWAAPVPLGDRGLARGGMPFAMNANGRAILLWERWTLASGWTLYASSFVPDQGWLAARPIYAAPTYTSPAVAINDAGTVFAAWLNQTEAWPEVHLYVARMLVDEGWQPPVLVGRTNRPAQPVVAVNTVGDAVVTWRTAFDYTIVANRYLAEGGWQGPQVLTPRLLENPVPFPSYLDDSGNIVCVWVEDDALFPRLGPLAIRRYNKASGWGEVEVLPFLAAVRGGIIGNIDLKFNRSGLAIAAWTELYSVLENNVVIDYHDLYSHRFLLASPVLNISRNETQVTLSWSTLAEGFELQVTSLLNPSAWNSISETPNVFEGTNRVMLPLTNQDRFFRLKKH